MSVLVALCLALQLSPRPPNVEFTSLFTFITGFIFGSLAGSLFGGFVMFVNGFFSPWGFAGLNMPFQMIGMALVGLTGGIYRKSSQIHSSTRFYVEVAVLGAFLTTFYDLITNLGVALSYILIGMQSNLAIITALAYGTPFSLIHVLSNLAAFGMAFFPVVKAASRVFVVENLG
ncbi:MAG: ECF transporter S component [Candidatus Bathycorpusculaceae bacterium]